MIFYDLFEYSSDVLVPCIQVCFRCIADFVQLKKIELNVNWLYTNINLTNIPYYYGNQHL